MPRVCDEIRGLIYFKTDPKQPKKKSETKTLFFN